MEKSLPQSSDKISQAESLGVVIAEHINGEAIKELNFKIPARTNLVTSSGVKITPPRPFDVDLLFGFGGISLYSPFTGVATETFSIGEASPSVASLDMLVDSALQQLIDRAYLQQESTASDTMFDDSSYATQRIPLSLIADARLSPRVAEHLGLCRPGAGKSFVETCSRKTQLQFRKVVAAAAVS